MATDDANEGAGAARQRIPSASEAMNRPEAALQRTIAAYLGWALAPPAYWSAIGHGGGGQMRGRILKGMGVKAGIPDLFIWHDGHTYAVEIKAEKGRVSGPQDIAHAALLAAGVHIAVIRSLDDLKAYIAGPWWPLQACIRETKPATERIKRGFMAITDPNFTGGIRSEEYLARLRSGEFPESDNLGRKRRLKV